MFRDLLVPLGMVGIVAGMLLPLPAPLLGILLVANLIMALALVLSTLYVSEPLKLSALPTLLLLATLYRLALNISTTRLILAGGDAGEVVQAFGAVVAQGNLLVGVVVFLVITLVQFIVVAKGAERVAEVSARFTLDALPGRQMSIDADVRAGLIDFNAARQKRQELQTESRFYGALDGAMKFVKGDAIAGIIITAINIVGGIAAGILMYDLDPGAAVSRFTILTIGDGLLAQIPSLLNSIAAGLVVTRVARGDGASLVKELPQQLGQLREVKLVLGGAAMILPLVSGLPVLPFALIGGLLLMAGIWPGGAAPEVVKAETESFKPRPPAIIEVEVGTETAIVLRSSPALPGEMEAFRRNVYQELGLILALPEFSVAEDLKVGFRVRVRGVKACQIEASGTASEICCRLREVLSELVRARCVEFVDDRLTRRTLDHYDGEAPELVSAVIPGIVSVTQLTEVLKGLLREGVSVRNFDVIMQAVAESGPKSGSERSLLEEIRIALKNQISERYVGKDGLLRGVTLDPLLDLALVKCEREKQVVDPEWIEGICTHLSAGDGASVLVVSRGARRLLSEALSLRHMSAAVLAFDEISDAVMFQSLGVIRLSEEQGSGELLERLAA